MEKKYLRTSWDVLPSELWEEIGKRMGRLLDVKHFRLVCKLWRSSLPPPTRFPLHVPPPPGDENNANYSIAELGIYSVDQLGFVALEAGKVGTSVVVPLGAKIDLKKHWQRLSKVAKTYHLRDSRASSGATPYNSFVRKIVLICPSWRNDGGVDHANYARASDVSVVALLAQGNKLALWRLTSKNWEWDTAFCSGTCFEDIVAYKGQLCALESTGRAFLMDYHSLLMTQVSDPLAGHEPKQLFQGRGDGQWPKQLFEARGDLYMLGAPISDETDLRVYKLSFEDRKWLEVQRLGGLAFGLGCDFHLSAVNGRLDKTYHGPSFTFSSDKSMMRTVFQGFRAQVLNESRYNFCRVLKRNKLQLRSISMAIRPFQPSPINSNFHDYTLLLG